MEDNKEKHYYQKGKLPTAGQMAHIYFITRNLGIEFKGKTAKDATAFINQHLSRALDEKRYSQIKYF